MTILRIKINLTLKYVKKKNVYLTLYISICTSLGTNCIGKKRKSHRKIFSLVLAVNPVRTSSELLKNFRTEPTRPKTLSNRINSNFFLSSNRSSRFGSIWF